MKPRSAAALLLLALAATAAAAPKIEKRTLVSRDKERTYYLFVPPGVTAEQPAPLIVMLHGSGRNGKPLVDRVDRTSPRRRASSSPARTRRTRCTGPRRRTGRSCSTTSSKTIAAKHPIDPRRVYLFGHSAGAVFALQMACLESEYFAAAAVHAGAVDPRTTRSSTSPRARSRSRSSSARRTRSSRCTSVRATAEALKARGFPVTLTEMPGHTHDYSSKSKEINAQIWELFSRTAASETDPKYRVVRRPEVAPRPVLFMDRTASRARRGEGLSFSDATG